MDEQYAIAELDADFWQFEANSYATAMNSFATADPSPWATLEAARAVALRDYVDTAAPAAQTRREEQAEAVRDEKLTVATVTEDDRIGRATAERVRQVAGATVSVVRATARAAGNALAVMTGTYNPKMPADLTPPLSPRAVDAVLEDDYAYSDFTRLQPRTFLYEEPAIGWWNYHADDPQFSPSAMRSRLADEFSSRDRLRDDLLLDPAAELVHHEAHDGELLVRHALYTFADVAYAMIALLIPGLESDSLPVSIWHGFARLGTGAERTVKLFNLSNFKAYQHLDVDATPIQSDSSDSDLNGPDSGDGANQNNSAAMRGETIEEAREELKSKITVAFAPRNREELQEFLLGVLDGFTDGILDYVRIFDIFSNIVPNKDELLYDALPEHWTRAREIAYARATSKNRNFENVYALQAALSKRPHTPAPLLPSERRAHRLEQLEQIFGEGAELFSAAPQHFARMYDLSRELAEALGRTSALMGKLRMSGLTTLATPAESRQVTVADIQSVVDHLNPEVLGFFNLVAEALSPRNQGMIMGMIMYEVAEWALATAITAGTGAGPKLAHSMAKLLTKMKTLTFVAENAPLMYKLEKTLQAVKKSTVDTLDEFVTLAKKFWRDEPGAPSRLGRNASLPMDLRGAGLVHGSPRFQRLEGYLANRYGAKIVFDNSIPFAKNDELTATIRLNPTAATFDVLAHELSHVRFAQAMGKWGTGQRLTNFEVNLMEAIGYWGTYRKGIVSGLGHAEALSNASLGPMFAQSAIQAINSRSPVVRASLRQAIKFYGPDYVEDALRFAGLGIAPGKTIPGI